MWKKVYKMAQFEKNIHIHEADKTVLDDVLDLDYSNHNERCKSSGKVTSKENSTGSSDRAVETNVKPYQCGFCGKSFQFLVNFAVHNRLHAKNVSDTPQKKFSDVKISKPTDLKEITTNSSRLSNLGVHDESSIANDTLRELIFAGTYFCGSRF